MAMSVSRRSASPGTARHVRPLASPAERFTLADGAVAVGTGATEALLVRTRKTPAGRFWWPAILIPFAGIVAIETAGYTRAMAVSVLATSAGLVAIEAKDSLT